MAVAVVFTPSSMNASQYDEIIRQLEQAGAGSEIVKQLDCQRFYLMAILLNHAPTMTLAGLSSSHLRYKELAASKTL